MCRNIRIKRCRIYREEAFRGYNDSKKEYFDGVKACVIATAAGEPVEVLSSPGSYHDICALRSMDLNLPDGARIYRDKGFLDTEFEAGLEEEAGLSLVVPRRKNMKAQLNGCVQYIAKVIRKRVETTFSVLSEHLARSIHAVTARGFELKVFLTVLIYSIAG